MLSNWSTLSPEQKREARFTAWLAAENVQFVDSEAAKYYRQRVQRFIDVIQLHQPDRVPVVASVSYFPAAYSGLTFEESMYDYARTAAAWEKYTYDFDPDVSPGGFGPGSGKALEMVDYHLFRWPGHSLASNIPFQCVEAEYMKAEEYDEFIADPSSFFLHKYLGRICGKLQPFQKLPSLFVSLEFPTFLGSLITLGDPAVQEALESLMKAGREAAKWTEIASITDKRIASRGYPGLSGGFTKAPFDNIGDTLRGTVGIMKDMYRQPDKLLKAIEQITPIMIEMGRNVPLGASPIVGMPLHKGANGFMSEAQFRRFYWPSLKAVILALINEGLVPNLFAEGGYSSRLEMIKELPPGKTIWHFDQTDMKTAKEVLGHTACIMGNVPSSLLASGSVDDMRSYCRNLIDVAGKGGGFILATGSVVDHAKPENLKAMMDIPKTYGVY